MLKLNALGDRNLTETFCFNTFSIYVYTLSSHKRLVPFLGLIILATHLDDNLSMFGLLFIAFEMPGETKFEASFPIHKTKRKSEREEEKGRERETEEKKKSKLLNFRVN